MNLLRDCHLRTHQTLSGHTKTKQCITRGRRNNYAPCWDKECGTLYHSFTWAPVGTDSDKAASSLLSRLGQNKQEQWDEPVNSINFSHSSNKAWRTINKLTGRPGRQRCTESEIFDSDTAPALAEYTLTPLRHIVKFWNPTPAHTLKWII